VQDATKYQEFYADLKLVRLECQRRRDASKNAEKNSFISIYSKMSSESSWGRLMRQRFRFKFLKMDYTMNITETTPMEAVLGNVVPKMKLNDEFSDWATRKIRQIASDADEVTEVFAILVGDTLNREGLEVLHRCVRKSKGTGMWLEELMSRMPDPSGYLCCAYGRWWKPRSIAIPHYCPRKRLSLSLHSQIIRDPLGFWNRTARCNGFHQQFHAAKHTKWCSTYFARN
jgi:hypothetical protein